MANWKYKLDIEGKELRTLISLDDSNPDYDVIDATTKILGVVSKCMEKILEWMKKDKNEDGEYYADELCVLVQDDLEALKANPNDFFESYVEYNRDNPEQEYTNGILREFYDFCDTYRVWIGLL